MKRESPLQLLIYSPQGQQTEFPLVENRVSIGRAEQNKIVLFDERASRSHAILERNGDGYTLTDLQSRNGTYLNGVEMKRGGSRQLTDGDEIKIGNFRLVYKVGAEPKLDYDDNPLAGTFVLQSAADLLRPLSTVVGPDKFRVSSGGYPSLATLPPTPSPVGMTSLADADLSTEIDVLVKRSRILGMVYELNKILTRVFKVEEIFAAIADQIFKISNGGRVVFAFPKDDEVEIHFGKYRDDLVLQRYEGIPVSRTIIKKAIMDRVSILSVDPMMDQALKSSNTFKLGRIRSVMCAPLFGQDDRAFGALYVDRPEAIGFSDEDLNFLTAVAANAAMAIENIRTHEKLMRDAQARLTYQRFLPQHVVDQIMEHPDSLLLGGVNQVVTMLFADIRGFTTLSERKTPQEIVVLLNNYFERASNAIFKHNGTLDKFIGDGIMSLFGAPQPSDADPVNAIQAAIAMQREVQAMNRELEEQGTDFRVNIGIGINTGEVTAGYIGSKLRTDYTVIGDAVNLAARLESNAKPGQILIGEQTYARARAYMMGMRDNRSVEGQSLTAWTSSASQRFDFVMRPIGGLKVKGKTKAVQVYQVLWDDKNEEPTSDNVQTVAASGSPEPANPYAYDGDKQRRKEPRINLCVKMRVIGVDVEGNPFDAECLTSDISLSGACLNLEKETRIGERMWVQGTDRVFRAQVEIRSVRLNQGYYKTGVQFVSSYPIWQIK
ncbi:MAG: FHA domain-containing protein [Blastocatellia bacterium]|nr:FHA domain-containing protein [Blastocatellia bacterium]